MKLRVDGDVYPKLVKNRSLLLREETGLACATRVQEGINIKRQIMSNSNKVGRLLPSDIHRILYIHLDSTLPITVDFLRSSFVWCVFPANADVEYWFSEA